MLLFSLASGLLMGGCGTQTMRLSVAAAKEVRDFGRAAPTAAGARGNAGDAAAAAPGRNKGRMARRIAGSKNGPLVRMWYRKSDDSNGATNKNS